MVIVVSYLILLLLLLLLLSLFYLLSPAVFVFAHQSTVRCVPRARIRLYRARTTVTIAPPDSPRPRASRNVRRVMWEHSPLGTGMSVRRVQVLQTVPVWT